ncbi:MAG TPA: N-acetylglucosamine-6-phosphate deacetylase [Pyrinomonadaceae bacterium]|jgi:N-acetylglucosamine-6-phosphate deacetylase
MTTGGRDETAAAGESTPGGALLLRGARVVLPGGVADDAAILVEGGRIARVWHGRQPEAHAPHARDIDLRGATLYPGFIDVHIHGAVGVDALAASAEDLRRLARFLVSRGVTAWLPTLVPAPAADYRRAADAISSLMRGQREEAATGRGAHRPPAARALGVHYEGPFVNSAQCGALRTRYFRTYAGASSLEGLAAPEDPRAVRMMTVAPEIEGGVALVGELAGRGWIVSLGHTRAEPSVLDAARAAGARHMTHFFNAMSPLHHRAPGAVGWGLLADDVTCDIIADGIHCDPAALRIALRCKGADRLALISDAVLPAGLGDGGYEVWGETISVSGGRTQNARGSIAGSVITSLDAARTMLSLGARPEEVARMASLTPARLLGIDDECGSIEEGKRADLVAVDDGGGRVRLTLVGGRVAFDAEN